MKKQQQQTPTANWVLALFFGGIFIFALVKCNEPSTEEIEHQREMIAQDSILKEIQDDNDKLEKIPLETDMKNAYKLLKENKESLAYIIIQFERVTEKAKGTKYQPKLYKTLNELYLKQTNETFLEKVKDRKDYQERLHNVFLDNNLDIKVKVYGKHNQKIKLTYVLFNDVWLRKFETEGWLNQIQREGFKKIEFSDGYDYNMYYTYK